MLAEMSSLVSLISLLVTKSSCPYITLVTGYSLRTEIYPPSPECIKVPHLPQVLLYMLLLLTIILTIMLLSRPMEGQEAGLEEWQLSVEENLNPLR